MKILGSLGLDWKIFLIQALNFLILFLILKWLFFKHFIIALKKEKAKEKEIQEGKNLIEKQKLVLQTEKEKEMSEAKKRAQEIIKEAKSITQELKKETREKIEKEVVAITKQTKDKLESLKPEIKKKILKDLQVKISNSFRTSFLTTFSLSAQKEFQNVFWTDFIKRIKRLTLQELKEPNLVEILKKFNITAEQESEKKAGLEKKLQKILIQKIGPVVLEYVYPLAIKQEKELEEIILEKSGIKINIIKKQNKNLINGFRFEIAGMIIESNLLNIINDATNFKPR